MAIAAGAIVLAVLGGCRQDEVNLHLAAQHGQIDVVRDLLHRGAEIDAVDASGATPLVYALLHGRSATAVLLIESGADIEAESVIPSSLFAHLVPTDEPMRARLRPLMVAAMADDHPAMRLLLDRGAAIDASGEQGVTALHTAAMAGKVDAVRLLLEYGARPDARLHSGETALDLAREMDRPSTVAALEAVTDRYVGPAVDVQGHHTIAAATAQDERTVRAWGALPVAIAVSADGTVFWTQYRTDSIHRAAADGTGREEVATVGGPMGVTVDPVASQVYFTSDRNYPRIVGRLAIDGTLEPLVHGRRVHRPAAMALMPGIGIFWSESINGRIQRADFDGSNLSTVVDDGISSHDERPGAVPMHIGGVAVDARRRQLVWSDILSGTIRSMSLDGEAERVLLSMEDGLVVPAGIAIDPVGGHLFWADPGRSAIGRAELDGSNPMVVAQPDDGLIEPYGIAVDAERRRLYWTDLAHDHIAVRPLDGGPAEVFATLAANAARPDEVATARCGYEDGVAFLRHWRKAWRTCLVLTGAVKAVQREDGDMRRVAHRCAQQLAAIDTTRLRRALEEECSPDRTAEVFATLLDDGSHWIGADFPRAIPWIESLRPFVEILIAESAIGSERALAELDDVLGRLRPDDGDVGDDRRWSLPASGQRMRFGSTTQATAPGTFAEVPDDGSVRTGTRMQFVDNGDGTVTDQTTGLMWEKKCDGCGTLHDVVRDFAWQGESDELTVTGWLAAINESGGLGGYEDWRIPSFSELLSIVDYEHFNPAVGRAFDADRCGLGCDSSRDPDCSCTRSSAYWTSTPFPVRRTEADERAVVAFHLGISWGEPVHRHAHVRAVRGPSEEAPRPRFVDNGDGTVTDRWTRLMWEKKCACPGSRHDVDLRLYWSYDGKEKTIWDWLDDLNAQSGQGFAGHSDWRIPNVKELATLLDFESAPPTIAADLHQDACVDVTSTSCSRAHAGMHWTSTTFADFPAHAYGVNFALANIDDRLKTTSQSVRAVRGPVSP